MQPAIDEEVPTSPQMQHLESITEAELLEQGERVGVERAEPSGTVIGPVARPEMGRVGPAARRGCRLQHGRLVSRGQESIGGREASRARSDDGDPHDRFS